MTKKLLMPLMAIGVLSLGACQLENPPKKLVLPEMDRTAPPAPAPAPAPAAAAVDPNDGKGLYEANCAMCHNTGMMGAPKPGDKENWAPRIAQGLPLLIDHATNGFTGKSGAMPAKGGHPDLSDKSIEAIVNYMVDQSK